MSWNFPTQITEILLALCVAAFVVQVLLSNACRPRSNDMPIFNLQCRHERGVPCPFRRHRGLSLPVQWGIIKCEAGQPARCPFTAFETVRAPGPDNILVGLELPRQESGTKCDLQKRVREWVLRLRNPGPKHHNV